jgi:hypothetical protein
MQIGHAIFTMNKLRSEEYHLGAKVTLQMITSVEKCKMLSLDDGAFHALRHRFAYVRGL